MGGFKTIWWLWTKKALWALLALHIIFYVQLFVVLFSHPNGGGEFHSIFAYSNGGRMDIAAKVYLEYVISGGGLAFLLNMARYPTSHWVISGIAALVTQQKWERICRFPFQSEEFHQFCFWKGMIIIPIILAIGLMGSLAATKLQLMKKN